MWARFETLEAFDLWHTQIKEQIGIPLPDGISTEYTKAFLVDDGTYSAWVEDEYTQDLIEGLPYAPKKVWE